MKELVISIVILLLCSSNSAYSPVIKTDSGSITGKLRIVKPFNGLKEEVYKFSGIPYAQPPVNDLRFKRPLPVLPWNGTLNATYDGEIVCPQRNSISQSEDCLTLTIWVPKDVLMAAVNNGTMVTKVYSFLHGGGFTVGSAETSGMTNGIHLAAHNKIIVVSIQYRLGVLGFGYLKNRDMPGNMGNWDQLEALKWIRVNIGYFGGDPSDLTLGGHDAGAVSAALLLTSDKGREFAKRLILQSGCPISPLAVKDAVFVHNMTRKLISNVCMGRNATECLKKADVEDLVEAEKTLNEDLFIFGSVFGPIVDGALFTKSATEVLESGELSNLNILIGNNMDEGTLQILDDIKITPTDRNLESLLSSINAEDFEDVVSKKFEYLSDSNIVANLTIEAILKEYNPDKSSGIEYFRALCQIDSDYSRNCPMLTFANMLSKRTNSIFAYVFAHLSKNGFLPEVLGVTHGDELRFVFDTLGDILGKDPNEKAFAANVMSYWGNFIKTGDPNDDSRSDNLRRWPPYSNADSCKYKVFLLSPNNESGECDFKMCKCQAWNDVIIPIARRLKENSYSSECIKNERYSIRTKLPLNTCHASTVMPSLYLILTFLCLFHYFDKDLTI